MPEALLDEAEIAEQDAKDKLNDKLKTGNSRGSETAELSESLSRLLSEASDADYER